jgi:hypothetical protein
LKQLEIEMKIKEREQAKAQRKMIADFKKIWFKPREDLEVEDLKVTTILLTAVILPFFDDVYSSWFEKR